MANFMKSVFLFCATFYVVLAKHEIYEGHSFYEVAVRNLKEAEFVNGLENQINIDVFIYATPDKVGQILVPKDVKPVFESLLTAQEIDYKMQVQNIREQLELEDQILAAASARNNRSRAIPGIAYDQIHRFQAVDDYLTRLGAAYPNTVKVESAGTSFEGRDMKYLKISTTNFEDTSKPVVYLMSLLHAREWVTLPGTLYAIEKLVIDVEEHDLLNTIDWIILPIANPDGYEFSHTNTRFWRKNRRTGLMIGNICMGVDLNRNFDVLWGTASSNNVCMDTFHGAGAFSEPETAAVRDILLAHQSRLALFIDLHSFGSMILFGFGNGVLAPNAFGLTVSGVQQAQAIDRVKWAQKPNYVVGNIVNVLGYRASGGSSDYGQILNIPYSFTYELPGFFGAGQTLNGFLVDPAFVGQAGIETWEGIKTGARFARDNFFFHNKDLR